MSDQKAHIIVENLKAGAMLFLERTGRNSERTWQDIEDFLDEIEPDIHELLIESMAGSIVALESLELFADATIARATRLTLELAEVERIALVAFIVACVRAAPGMALTAG